MTGRAAFLTALLTGALLTACADEPAPPPGAVTLTPARADATRRAPVPSTAPPAPAVTRVGTQPAHGADPLARPATIDGSCDVLAARLRELAAAELDGEARERFEARVPGRAELLLASCRRSQITPALARCAGRAADLDALLACHPLIAGAMQGADSRVAGDDDEGHPDEPDRERVTPDRAPGELEDVEALIDELPAALVGEITRDRDR